MFCRFVLTLADYQIIARFPFQTPITKNIKIYNKVGDAYGYLIDCAYIEDTDADIGFFLTAVIHVNADKIYNDNKYEYDETGLPFLAKLVHTLDIRIDKKWFFKKWALNAYLDIQNVYNFKAKVQPYVNVMRDAAGNPVEDPNNPNAYKIYLIENTTGTILPSIGMMIEF